MKYIHKIIAALALCAGVATACQDDEPAISGGLQLDKTEIAVNAEGGTEKVAVTSRNNWVASASQPWISVSPANGLGSAECVLAIDSTLKNTARTAEIRFTADGYESQLVTVTQMGFYKQIILKEPNVEIESSATYKNRNIEAIITSNVKFKINTKVEYSFAEDPESLNEADLAAYNEAIREGENKNWIELPEDKDLEFNLDRGARPRTIKVKFPWKMNVVPFTRVAKIRLEAADPEKDKLQDDNGNEIDAFYLTVTQKPAMKITDDRAGDSLAVITINQKIQCMVAIESSENMMNWSTVKLWEATDEAIKNNEVPKAAVGRVRSVSFAMINLNDGETLPKEIKYLKYLESFNIQSNENASIRNVSLGEEICGLEHLKNLSVYSYGMSELPENFEDLGRTLETLDLSANNFNSLPELLDVINPETFPNLYSLRLAGGRRTDALIDLQKRGEYITSTRPNLGMEVNLDESDDRQAMIQLLTWEKLRKLELSYNFIEGTFITDKEMEEALPAGKKIYSKNDFYDPENEPASQNYLDKLPSDTCEWLKPGTEASKRNITFQVGSTKYTKNNDENIEKNDNKVLRVLPHMRKFSINLNFITGELPAWLVFHPFFVEWEPTGMVLQQQEEGKDSHGNKVGFTGVDDPEKFNFTYYYGNETEASESAYPLYYKRYVANSSTDSE